MTQKAHSILNNTTLLICTWAVIIFLATILSVFLHEDGHGVGAKIDGIHVSTGFNKVGMPGKTPDDPDFRKNMPEGFWSGLLGPMTTWVLAICFTVWLYHFNEPSWGALAVGALALVNGLIRALPMLSFLFSALRGFPYLEDEVGWGVWIVVKYCHPELASLDARTLLATHSGVFLSDPFFWIPSLMSLAISLICLVFAYRRIIKLWSGKLGWETLVLFSLLPLIIYYLSWPLLNLLDRNIRINW